MKVAIVAYALNIGGMESFLFGLAERLRGSGALVTFVVTQSVGAWHDRPAQEGFPLESALPGDWESRRAHAFRVGTVLKEFDAVIVNHSLTAQSSLGLLPDTTVTVSVLHNNDDPVYRVGLTNTDNVDMVVAVSEGVLREAIRRGSPAERTVCIRNGVDVFPDYPKTAGSREAAPLRAAFVGRIDQKQKGALYLPGILNKAIAAGASLSLDVIGTGENDFELLKQQMSDLEQRGVAVLHGALPHDRAMTLLQSADVLLMPSHYEGQPIILFEAMARGVVPVVSLLPGITDAVIADNESGILAPIGDEASFAEALVRLAKERNTLARMSRAAWQTAFTNFGNETMTQKYLELIQLCRLKRERGELPPRTKRLCYEVLGKGSWRTPPMYRLCGKVEQLLKRLK